MTSVLIFCLIDGRVILDRDKAGAFNVFNNKSISANKEQQLLAIFAVYVVWYVGMFMRSLPLPNSYIQKPLIIS